MASTYKTPGVYVEEISKLIKDHLIDDEWFYASEWKVPDLHFDNWDSEDDHFLHEFHSLEETYEQPVNDSTIEDFITTIKSAKKYL